MILVYLAAGAVLGFVLGWIILRTKSAIFEDRLKASGDRLAETQTQLSEREIALESLRKENADLRSDKTALETQASSDKVAFEKQLAILEDAKRELSNAFKALSAEALKSNNESFLTLAQQNLKSFQDGARTDLDVRQKAIDELVKPLKESLEKVDANVRELEMKRSAAYSGITEQITALTNTQNLLRGETTNLVKALRTPQGRGRWGEVQLRRVVEMAGMVEHCDFTEQSSVDTADGRLRPDLTVYLAGGRTIIVDAKTPLSAYLDSLECADDDSRQQFIRQHAQQVRTHLDQLGGKSYWEYQKSSPEMVVMFLEAESIFSAALQGDPSLIEYGAQKKVIVATPTTLISLLRAIAYGWRQEQIAESAQVISELGKELYQRLLTLGAHFAKVGSNLESAVSAYNEAVGSLERSVLPGARKFKALGIQTKEEIKELKPLEKSVREIANEELLLTVKIDRSSDPSD